MCRVRHFLNAVTHGKRLINGLQLPLRFDFKIIIICFLFLSARFPLQKCTKIKYLSQYNLYNFYGVLQSEIRTLEFFMLLLPLNFGIANRVYKNLRLFKIFCYLSYEYRTIQRANAELFTHVTYAYVDRERYKSFHKLFSINI